MTQYSPNKMDKQSKIKQKEDEAMDIPYDEEAKCEKCGRIGQNTLQTDWEPIPHGSGEDYKAKFVVCKCGHEIREVEE